MSGHPPAAAAPAGIERGLRAVAGLLSAIGALSLAGIFVLVFASVFLRYVWGRPLDFTEELSGLLMTLAVFTLLPATVLKEVHIRVTVVSGLTHGALQRLMFLAGQLVLLVFCVLFVREAWAIAEFTHMLNLKSEQSRLPLAPFLVLSTAAMGLAGVAALWRTIKPMAPQPEDEVHP